MADIRRFFGGAGFGSVRSKATEPADSSKQAGSSKRSSSQSSRKSSAGKPSKDAPKTRVRAHNASPMKGSKKEPSKKSSSSTTSVGSRTQVKQKAPSTETSISRDGSKRVAIVSSSEEEEVVEKTPSKQKRRTSPSKKSKQSSSVAVIAISETEEEEEEEEEEEPVKPKPKRRRIKNIVEDSDTDEEATPKKPKATPRKELSQSNSQASSKTKSSSLHTKAGTKENAKKLVPTSPTKASSGKTSVKSSIASKKQKQTTPSNKTVAAASTKTVTMVISDSESESEPPPKRRSARGEDSTPKKSPASSPSKTPSKGTPSSRTSSRGSRMKTEMPLRASPWDIKPSSQTSGTPRKGSEAETKKKEEKKKPLVNPLDFFGSAPVQHRASPRTARGKGVEDGTPVKGGGTPVKGRDTLVKGRDTPVKGRDTPVKGRGTPAKDQSTPLKKSGKERGTPGRKGETPVKGKPDEVTEGSGRPTRQAARKKENPVLVADDSWDNDSDLELIEAGETLEISMSQKKSPQKPATSSNAELPYLTLPRTKKEQTTSTSSSKYFSKASELPSKSSTISSSPVKDKKRKNADEKNSVAAAAKKKKNEPPTTKDKKDRGKDSPTKTVHSSSTRLSQSAKSSQGADEDGSGKKKVNGKTSSRSSKDKEESSFEEDGSFLESSLSEKSKNLETLSGDKGGSTTTNYRAYLMRGTGATAPGSKEIPEGQPNCLEALTFVITGTLESLGRDEAQRLVEKYGGRVTTSVSGRTSYLVAGEGAGESKLAKAKSSKVKVINEDDLLELVKSKPGKKSKYEIAAEKEVATAAKASKSSSAPKPASKGTAVAKKDPPTYVTTASSSSVTKGAVATPPEMWVDKYKPTTMKAIIGQQGDKSCAKKLLHWLTHWHDNISKGVKPASSFGRFSRDETGAGHRAALLSGPPGIGKTTTATLVCNEAGFTFVENNASDKRSMTSIKTDLRVAVGSRSLENYFAGSSSWTAGRKHCIIMDEVDGMAGNEDRGGVQELIATIKASKVPIICMCNDRNHPKIRSLANHCFDLRFQRPRVEQIKGAMMTVAYKEGIKIPPPALNEIIAASNQDIRQVLHNLSMWSASNKSLTYEQSVKDAKTAAKDTIVGPFDACRLALSANHETAKMSIKEKADLFFYDYNMSPLFIQENYAHVAPQATRGNVKKTLRQLSIAADHIATGDIVSTLVRRGNWNLLPVQAMYSSVLPGEAVRGYMGRMVEFPKWLGKCSTKNKYDRIAQELKFHMSLWISGNRSDVALEYVPHLRTALTQPLIENETEGVREVVDVMTHYDLTREDYDNIMDMGQWSGKSDPKGKIQTKVKSAFTRTFNNESTTLPYAQVLTAKGGKKRGGGGGYESDGDGEDGAGAHSSEEEDDSAVIKAMMVKAKPKGGARKAASGKGTAAKGAASAAGKKKAVGKTTSQESKGKARKRGGSS